MTYLGDTLTVGLVLVLLFGSIALYLYTRIQQAEQKISLLESILLDLKMASEVQTYTELPADQPSFHRPKSPSPPHSPSQSTPTYQPFNDSQDDSSDESHVLTLEPIPESDSSELNESQDLPSQSHSVNNSVQLEVLDELNEVDEYKSVVAEAVNQASPKSSVQYENLTLKELQTLAKTRGITSAGTMKKGPLMEALRTSDRSTTVKPGSLSSGSFLETSASVSNELA
jgi:hypothetical protein